MPWRFTGWTTGGADIALERHAMSERFFPIAALLFGAAFLFVAHGAHGMIIPLRGDLEGFSKSIIGLIGAGWAVGYILGCLHMPRIVQRVGHVRAFGAVSATCAIVILALFIAIDATTWIVLRALAGFCTAGAYMIMESWLNERSTNDIRGTVFSIYVIISTLAMTAGQLMLSWQNMAGVMPFIAVAIFYCLSLLPTALSRAKSPEPLQDISLDLRSLYHNSPVALVGCFLVGITNSAYGNFAALYGKEIGLSVAMIAIMLSAALVGGSVTQLPIGRLSDKFDRRHVMIYVAMLASITGFVIWIVNPENANIVLAIMFVFGGLNFPLYSIAVAHANDYAKSENFVNVAGGLLLVYGIGTMVGPPLGAASMDVLGSAGLFVCTAFVHATIALYTLYRLGRRKPVSDKERVEFQGLPVTRTNTPETINWEHSAETRRATERAD